MIVSDASAFVELLLAGKRAEAVRSTLAPHTEIHVPEHFHVEVISALRRYSIRKELSELRAAQALGALKDLRAITYPVIEMLDEIWELRSGLTAYDAAYLALAERLDTGLITLDSALSKAAAGAGRLVEA